MLFLFVPGDPESGVVSVLDRKHGVWYAFDFEDEQFGGGRKLLVKKIAGVFPNVTVGVSEKFRCGTRDKETPTRVEE